MTKMFIMLGRVLTKNKGQPTPPPNNFHAARCNANMLHMLIFTLHSQEGGAVIQCKFIECLRTPGNRFL